MIRVMRDESAPDGRRDEMAKAAAPYVHPRLAAIEYARTLSGKPLSQMSDDDLMAIISAGQAKDAQDFDEGPKRSPGGGRVLIAL